LHGNIHEISTVTFFSLLLLTGSAVALEQSPDALVQQVTDDVLNIVRQDKDIQSGDTAKALKLVETKVLAVL
jgi:phospholipid transport system substrate-binding protein